MAESTNMSAAAKAFFASPRFVVAGASSDPRKFGNKSQSNDISPLRSLGADHIHSIRMVHQALIGRNTTKS